MKQASFFIILFLFPIVLSGQNENWKIDKNGDIEKIFWSYESPDTLAKKAKRIGEAYIRANKWEVYNPNSKLRIHPPRSHQKYLNPPGSKPTLRHPHPFPEFSVTVSNIEIWNEIITDKCGVGEWTNNTSGAWNGQVPFFVKEAEAQYGVDLQYRGMNRRMHEIYALDPYAYFPKAAKYFHECLTNEKRSKIIEEILESVHKKYGDQIALLKVQEEYLKKLEAKLEAKKAELLKKEKEQAQKENQLDKREAFLDAYANTLLEFEKDVAEQRAQVEKDRIKLEKEMRDFTELKKKSLYQ